MTTLEQEFFHELQKHSEAKLTILNNYVIPWMRKIVLGTRKYGGDGKCLVIDGFAGAGIYDDGSLGSPMILLKNAIDFWEQSLLEGWEPPEIFLIFVEGNDENHQSLLGNMYDFCGYEAGEKFFSPVPDHPSIQVSCINDEFKNVLESLQAEIRGLMPSFCFIDPFGFSQTPFSLIEKYMRNRSAEMLLNFIYEETNRFLTVPSVQNRMCEFFGVDSLDEIHALVKGKSPVERKQNIVQYYTTSLNTRANVRHVLSFEIRKNGRTKLILFFGTKHYEGLSLMKKIMWNVDGTGAYLYDDQNSTDQIEFTFMEDLRFQDHIKNLAHEIYQQFAGRESVPDSSVEEFVVLKTNYPADGFYKKALKWLEENNYMWDVKKKSGARRNKGTFSDVFIHFR